MYVVGKERRENPTFIGGEKVKKQLAEGPSRRRIGLVVDGAPARQGAKIFKPSSDEQIGMYCVSCSPDRFLFSLRFFFPFLFSEQGIVTSGIPSPTLGKNIAMGYIRNGWHKKGTEVEVEVRKLKRKGVLTPMPFIKPSYYRGS